MDKNVTEFRTEREAKEYLAGRIVEEARREGTPLTEVERKMLYFTESGWTLPDMMSVNEQFERDYVPDDYEQKIGKLAANIQARDAAESEQDQTAWDDAVVKLSDGDHYLLVLINSAPSTAAPVSPWLPVLSGPAPRPPGDIVRLILTAIGVLALILPFFALMTYIRGRSNH
jgi:hypothetical protein